jgi:ankyrin repeat protein
MMPSKNHLIKLIENDDWESLEFLLDHTKLTYQLNKKINWSNTLLNIVIKNKKINCLKILLKHPNIQNCFCVLSKRNKICLDIGIQTNNIQIIQLLLEHPQIHLCLDNHYNCDERLEKLVIDIFKTDCVGPIIKIIFNQEYFINLAHLILEKSIEANNIQIVQLLLKHHTIDDFINKQYKDKYTPLHLAIREKNIQIIKLLLEHHCIYESFVLQDYKGHTPLHLIIVNNGYEENPNPKFTDPNRIYICKLLLDQPHIENCFDIKANWNRRLIVDAIRRNIQIVKLLFGHPQIDKCFISQDCRGQTPLHIILKSYLQNEYKNTKILKLFFKHPQIHLCLDIKSDDGYTPLDLITLLPTNIKIYQIYMEIKRWNARKWWILGCTECLINID